MTIMRVLSHARKNTSGLKRKSVGRNCGCIVDCGCVSEWANANRVAATSSINCCYDVIIIYVRSHVYAIATVKLYNKWKVWPFALNKSSSVCVRRIIMLKKSVRTDLMPVVSHIFKIS